MEQGICNPDSLNDIQVSGLSKDTGGGSRNEVILKMGRFFLLLLQMKQLCISDDSYQLYARAMAWSRAVMTLFSSFSSSITRANTLRRFWMCDRGIGLDQVVLQTYTDLDFKKRLRISKATFQYLCHELGPLMVRQDTKFRTAISVETKIMIALSRLTTGDALLGIADSFRVGFATAQQANIEFATCVNWKLKELYIKWPLPNRMKTLAEAFERVHGIPSVIGAVDGSHIPIIAPQESPQDYYNRKGFHSLLLQLIVSRECLIWDFDIGWPGSIHDWTSFQRSSAGQRIMNGYIAPYCLVGDAAYPPRHYMLSPFKGHKDGLSKEEYYWNYVQSSTRMPVEQAFGRLEARFRILLKRNDMHLEKTVHVVSACLVLHNICIIHGDGFEENWAKEARHELDASIAHEKVLAAGTKRRRNRHGDVTNQHLEAMRYCQYGIYKLHGTSLTTYEALARTMDSESDASYSSQSHIAVGGDATRRNAIAKALFENKSDELIEKHSFFEFQEPDTSEEEEE